MLTILSLLACGPAPGLADTAAEAAAREVPWSGALPPLATELAPLRERVHQRAIVHLHSPWSHDACDGRPMPDGAPDPACLDDLRAGLCRTRVDVAFLTDHPNHASAQPYDALLHPRPGDERGPASLAVACDDGHVVRWLPGVEDELMPVGLRRHVHEDRDERHRLYNLATPEGLTAMTEAGALVLVPHTESRSLAHLQAMQDAGLLGVEIFNLHAMFAPDIRQDILGLDGLGWLTAVGPFTSPEGTAEPDLLFLAVLADQEPSLERWDALLARGPAVGVAGTDAHQNVLPIPLRDGERGDSYRRMLRWFSNVLITDGPGADAARDALAAGRTFVAFEILGTPLGFDVHLSSGGQVYEMGADAPAGTLTVACPTLSPSSPRGLEDPEIRVTVLRNGLPWRDGCGSWPTEGPGAYRVRVDLVPHHLAPFLGEDPEPWMRSYPWILGNAIRVGG